MTTKQRVIKCQECGEISSYFPMHMRDNKCPLCGSSTINSIIIDEEDVQFDSIDFNSLGINTRAGLRIYPS